MKQWYTEGERTNPADEAVLAETTAMPGAGALDCDVIVAATVAAGVRVEHRDAANAANVRAQLLFIPANATVVVKFGPLNLAVDERVRVVMEAALTGRIQASLVTLP